MNYYWAATVSNGMMVEHVKDFLTLPQRCMLCCLGPFLFNLLSPWCLSDFIFMREWRGGSLSVFSVGAFIFPSFSFSSWLGFSLSPSSHLPCHSQSIQTRQVAPSLWGWSLGSSLTGRSQPPALTARGVSTRSHGTLSLPDWTNRERPTLGLLLRTAAQSGFRLENVTLKCQNVSAGFESLFLKVLFLQVDLEKTKRLTGIITQGAKDFGVVQYVSVFKIAYSNDGESWSTVKEEDTGNEKVRQA